MVRGGVRGGTAPTSPGRACRAAGNRRRRASTTLGEALGKTCSGAPLPGAGRPAPAGARRPTPKHHRRARGRRLRITPAGGRRLQSAPAVRGGANSKAPLPCAGGPLRYAPGGRGGRVSGAGSGVRRPSTLSPRPRGDTRLTEVRRHAVLRTVTDTCVRLWRRVHMDLVRYAGCVCRPSC
ncbi:putative leader peptide [Streptomyces echinatus]|uniref:putative leader peptide n=1 Tax=Streptomyces echinatus TaxID=67293 RepID=UPI003788C3DD